MQYLVIVLIAALAVALVMVPLVRGQKRSAAGDLDPLPPSDPGAGTTREGGDPSRPVRTAGSPPERPLTSPPPEPRSTPEPRIAPEGPQPPGELDGEELPQAAPPPPVAPRPGDASLAALPRVEQEVLRYREALRARTLCARCSTANTPGTRFCRECGAKL